MVHHHPADASTRLIASVQTAITAHASSRQGRVIMGEYFKTWGRKVGVVTLMLSCALAALWARTCIVRDSVMFPVGQSAINLISFQQTFYGIVFTELRPDHQIKSISVDSERAGISLAMPWGDDNQLLPADEQWKWNFRVWGFESGISIKKGVYYRRACIIPYWMPVIFLTLLSAWLPLRNPRKPQGRFLGKRQSFRANADLFWAKQESASVTSTHSSTHAVINPCEAI